MAHGVTEKVVVLVELDCVFSWAEISKQANATQMAWILS